MEAGHWSGLGLNLAAETYRDAPLLLSSNPSPKQLDVAEEDTDSGACRQQRGEMETLEVQEEQDTLCMGQQRKLHCILKRREKSFFTNLVRFVSNRTVHGT